MSKVISANWRAFLFWWKTAPKMIIFLIVQNIISAIIPYIGIYFSAQLINELAGARNPERLWQLVMLVLFSTIGLTMLNSLLYHIRAYYGQPSMTYLEKAISDKFRSMDFCDLDSNRVHELHSTILQYIQWASWGMPRIPWNIETLTSSVTKIIGAAALSVSLFFQKVPVDSSLAFLNHPLCIILLLIIMIAVVIISPFCSTKADTYWAKSGEQNTFGNRMFGFLANLSYQSERSADVRIYRQDKFCDSVQKSALMFNTDCYLARMARGPMGLLQALSTMISKVFTGVVYLFVCLKAWGGAFGIGSVTQYVSAITSMSDGISSLLRCVGEMKNNVPHIERTFELLDIPNNMYQGSLTIEKRNDRKYEVEFRDVSFRYPGAETDALSHVSFKFRIGERLAVVGENGSGKTTMIKLLCRLYDPTEGQILLNGIDIRKYNYKEYMSIFSVVFQDFQLMAFPLGQNIAGAKDYDPAKVKQCLNDVGFGERLDSMEQGLDTCLYRAFDEKGVEVSGGEAQKIAIARALYKNAAFIVLDEPTAALDPVAEADVYSRFDTLVQDKTAIYISHRLSSCRFCDKIAVFDRGHIVQLGSHERLVKENGKYAQLWNAQAQYYT